MEFLLPIQLEKLPVPIRYTDAIMLTGSCFTEHMGHALADLKFSVLQNPNGILFTPDSVCKSLLSYTRPKKYSPDELFSINEIWHSWQHHSRFSHINRQEAINTINQSHQEAHTFLQKANWLIITLGSSFAYRLTAEAVLASAAINEGVANCHRAPANWFTKKMLETEEIKTLLEDCIRSLQHFNPTLRFIFTVSPVRHSRDGVVENNRSKARLIEAVHYITTKFESTSYFPAYELVIDVLRDYRFYDIDMVHPNYAATTYVLEKFIDTSMDTDTKLLMEEIKKIRIARNHKPFQPATKAHRQFLSRHFELASLLQQKYPFLNLEEELAYFANP